jgi:hypothetical protein
MLTNQVVADREKAVQPKRAGRADNRQVSWLIAARLA